MNSKLRLIVAARIFMSSDRDQFETEGFAVAKDYIRLS